MRTLLAPTGGTTPSGAALVRALATMPWSVDGVSGESGYQPF
jgi:hypothetical protein